jgi:hypothetical protein
LHEVIALSVIYVLDRCLDVWIDGSGDRHELSTRVVASQCVGLDNAIFIDGARSICLIQQGVASLVCVGARGVAGIGLVRAITSHKSQQDNACHHTRAKIIHSIPAKLEDEPYRQPAPLKLSDRQAQCDQRCTSVVRARSLT